MIGSRTAIASEIAEALSVGRGVVALESTVIAMGLPWPANHDTAREVEAAVRAAGAAPATIAVLEGVTRIGVSDAELIALARSAVSHSSPAANDRAEAKQQAGGSVRQPTKANRRDLAAVMSRGATAATTVSATLWIARRFGLRPYVMATGGLGGVHREAAESFDISADLDELARADGALIVCSGPKSILDVRATLEALETRGVLVAGYRTNELPGFLTRSAGLPLEHRVDSPEEAAALVRSHRALGLPGAIVLAQPVPDLQALDPALMEAALDAAESDAKAHRLTGKALTPFLLESIHRATGDRSLIANCALLVSNARLAAEIASILVVNPGDDLP